MIEWTDKDGNRAVVHRGHLSAYGRASMTADDGTVAVGVDLAAARETLVDEVARVLVRDGALGVGVTPFRAGEMAEDVVSLLFDGRHR